MRREKGRGIMADEQGKSEGDSVGMETGAVEAADMEGEAEASSPFLKYDLTAKVSG